MEQTLLQGVATLEASRTKNFTCPDNIFSTAGIRDCLRSCETVPEKRPARTDHFPIRLILDSPTATAAQSEWRDYRRVDWDAFDTTLTATLETRSLPGVINSIDTFDSVLTHLMQDLQSTIEEHVPMTASTPYAKRWWSLDLSKMHKEKEWLARRAYCH
ncbi:hypothetical protein GY45DRAFT_1264143, partial [Cubamyces sp. BRFM 1775]